MLAGQTSHSAVGLPFLGTRPYTLSGFAGAEDTLSSMVEAAQGRMGEQSMLVRGLVDDIVSGVQPKDYLGEILAVRFWVAEHIRYVNDPVHVEMVKSPQTLVEEYLKRGVATGDCDDIGCTMGTFHLVLGRDAQLCAVGFGAPGHYSHVFERCLEPRTNQWIVCDPVAGTRERTMLRGITTYQIWSLDELPNHGPIRSK